MNYGRTKRTLITFLISYAFIGFGAHITSASNEDAYPFFSWFLFVTVPPRVQSGFDIVIVSAHGQKLEIPAFPLNRPDVFVSGGLTEGDISALAERLGRSVLGRQDREVLGVRSELETHFNTPRATYVVREFTYDPLEYFKSKSVASTTVLAEFTVGK